MANSSNLPRHGDAIILKTSDNFGGSKLIASRQFQQFLDELGSLSNTSSGETVDISDLLQIVSKNQSISSSSISNLLNKISLFNSQIEIINDQIVELESITTDNEQLIAVQNSIIRLLGVQLSEAVKRIDNLEQLIHVN